MDSWANGFCHTQVGCPGIQSSRCCLLQVPTDAYHPVIANLTDEQRRSLSLAVALRYLQDVSLSLPHRALSQETALNLTQVRLLCVWWSDCGPRMVLKACILALTCGW